MGLLWLLQGLASSRCEGCWLGPSHLLSECCSRYRTLTALPLQTLLRQVHQSPGCLLPVGRSSLARRRPGLDGNSALVSALPCLGGDIGIEVSAKHACVTVLCRDLWMPGACFCLLFATLIAGLVELGRSPTISSPLAISVLWAVYNMISPFLVLWSVIPSVLELGLASLWLSTCGTQPGRGLVCSIACWAPSVLLMPMQASLFGSAVPLDSPLEGQSL